MKLLLGLATLALAVSGSATGAKNHQFRHESASSNIDTVIYSEDFESMNLGETAVWSYTKFWPATADTMSITELNGSKALTYSYIGSGNVGGINTQQTGHHGEDLFEAGATYRLEMDVEVSEGNKFQVDFKNDYVWTSFFLEHNTVSNHQNMKGVEYDNGHAILDFVAPAGAHYFEIYSSNSNPGTLTIDNFTITKLDTTLYANNYSVNAECTYLDNWASLQRVPSTNGQSYMHFYGNDTSKPSWPVMYFNHLPFTFTAGHNYRIVIDLVEAPVFSEFYINMVGNWAGHTTYGVRTDGSVYIADNAGTENLTINYSAAAHAIVVDFPCEANLAEQQIRFCGYAAAGVEMDFKFASFTVYDLDLISAKEFASRVLDLTNSCDPTGQTRNVSDENWTTLSTEYAALSARAKDYLVGGDADEYSSRIISRALARYDYVAGKYGLTNFIVGRTVASSYGLNAILAKENVTVFVVLASFLVILPFAFLGLRKKNKLN